MSVTPPSEQLPQVQDFDIADDYESLVMDVCQLLSETDCHFTVSGFGQEGWPVNVSYDLSSVIEQLPTAIANLQRGLDAEIDLYGQGIERRLDFTLSGNLVEIRCTSSTKWSADPSLEVLPHEEALSLLTGLAREFGIAVQRALPDLAAKTPFAKW
ncbi:hypothetical protein [Streptomyces sp. NPDC001820]|uniref:hypothetical protein n=1 Tax=Streptomyces sp. NPDC001820 TaxID=3364613 RepID=UPI0036895A0F